jgi:hypothetical protein
MNAPASRMNTPNGCSPPASAVARAVARTGAAGAERTVDDTAPPK